MLVLITTLIIFAVALIVIMPASVLDKIERATNAHIDDSSDDVVKIPLKEMDKHFERFAGRYCAHCGVHGSHHTDIHNEFALKVISYNS